MLVVGEPLSDPVNLEWFGVGCYLKLLQYQEKLPLRTPYGVTF